MVFAIMPVMILEHWPSPLPLASRDYPAWVGVVRDFPGRDPILNAVDAGDSRLLYFQTIHHKPMALGYVARMPKSARDKAAELYNIAHANDFRRLRREFGFRFVITDKRDPFPQLAELYTDDDVHIYDLNFFD
jgi:hypothetical protein